MQGLHVLLVDGTPTPATGGATFETVDPTTEEVLGVAAHAAPSAARRASDDDDDDVSAWTTDVAFRVRCLRQPHDALAAQADEAV